MEAATGLPLGRILLVEDASDHRLLAVEVLVDDEPVAQLATHRVETRQDATALTETTIALHGDYVDRKVLERPSLVARPLAGLTDDQRGAVLAALPNAEERRLEIGLLFQKRNPAWEETEREWERDALRVARRLGFVDEDALHAIQETIRRDAEGIAGLDLAVLDGDRLRETAIKLLDLLDDQDPR